MRSLDASYHPAARASTPSVKEEPEEQPGRPPAIPLAYWQHYGITPGQPRAAAQCKVDVALRTDEAETEAPATGVGARLPEAVQAKMERALGADFSSVRVHEGAYVARAGAQAWTRGSDVHFAPGRYDPHGRAGQELLGHELAHVVQQAQGRVAPVAQGKGLAVNADAALEQEADRLGAEAARCEEPPAAGMGTRTGTVARAVGGAGGAIQRKMAVAILTDDASNDPATVKITDVQIAGRPERKHFANGGGRSEGDHTTAWSVMRLAVYNRLRGLTLKAAFAEVDKLLAEAQALPGASQDRIKAMGTQQPDDRGTFSNEAKKAAVAAKAQGAAVARQPGTTANQAQTRLQEYIAAYLKYRNSIGLSVMDLGRASGDGEAGLLKVLQYWEGAWSDQKTPNAGEKADILNALGALFSPSVIANLQDNDPNLPGVKHKANEDKSTIQAALRDQHFSSLKSAFPNVMRRLAPQAADVEGQMGAKWTGTLPDAAKGVSTGAAFAVQLTLDAQDRVAAVHCSGRPKHATAGGLEGDHTTAYVLSTRAIEKAVLGKDLATAANDLDAVEQTFRAMPGAEQARLDRMTDERKALYASADAELRAARGALGNRQNGNVNNNNNNNGGGGGRVSMSSLQRYAGALLFFRNSIGLTVVGAETDSRGKGEAAKLKSLEDLEAHVVTSRGAIDQAVIVEALAGLFDRKAISRYADATRHNQELTEAYGIKQVKAPGAKQANQKVSDLIRDEQLEDASTQDVLWDFDEDDQRANSRKDPYPGFVPGESLEKVVAAAMKQHLESVRLVAPNVYKMVDGALLRALVIELAGGNLIAVDKVEKRVKRLDGSTANRVHVKKGAKRKNKGSDDEYDPKYG